MLILWLITSFLLNFWSRNCVETGNWLDFEWRFYMLLMKTIGYECSLKLVVKARNCWKLTSFFVLPVKRKETFVCAVGAGQHMESIWSCYEEVRRSYEIMESFSMCSVDFWNTQTRNVIDSCYALLMWFVFSRTETKKRLKR